jgi:hypothetical protein
MMTSNTFRYRVVISSARRPEEMAYVEASQVSVSDGALIMADSDGSIALALPAGEWAHVARCDAHGKVTHVSQVPWEDRA